MNILWSSKSRNKKTGNIPTAWIGSSKEEAWNSCEGCGLRGNGCYAWSGSPGFAQINVQKSAKKGNDKSLDFALKNKHKDAKVVRLTSIGDIGRSGKIIADKIVNRVKAEAMSIVGYTHHWDDPSVAESWKGRLMASCETESDADRAVSQGWRATMIVGEDSPKSFKTSQGNKVSVCPAQIQNKKINCNTCRLCDASRNLVPIVAFIAHGNGKKKIKKM